MPFLENFILPAAAITAITTLFSMSELFEPIRRRLWDRPFSCPICLTYWIAAPYLYYGPSYYLALVFFSIVGVLFVTKTYNELTDFDYMPK